ncbi:hypothetical protein B0H14DRAFT_2762141 [Mycena olivaceomarginata]|nr:hypothetical protein B0H14DRAFT_2891612 [Mycena olivaceomarginata]KAJ7851120.1 hypothetical protein B0H14DRAFT_2762141 [Mycena olivaceomarginata]
MMPRPQFMPSSLQRQSAGGAVNCIPQHGTHPLPIQASELPGPLPPGYGPATGATLGNGPGPQPTRPSSATLMNLQQCASPQTRPNLASSSFRSTAVSPFQSLAPLSAHTSALTDSRRALQPVGGAAPDMQDVTPDMQDGGAPPELHSLPEAHGVITPPSTFAPEASPGVNNERESCARLNEEVEMEMDDDSADAEEEDTDYIEVGPDGLRTTEDCVASVFDPQKNFVCRFCEARYKADMDRGLPSEPPPEMPDASLEERAAHCEREHEYVWGILRHAV